MDGDGCQSAPPVPVGVQLLLMPSAPRGPTTFCEGFSERKFLDLPLAPGLYFLQVRAGDFR